MARFCEPLDEAEVKAVAERLAGEGIEAVAVCFLHSYANPAHEQRAAALLAARLPNATVTTSAEVLPEFREYERFSTTALNAYVAPRMRRYLSDLGTTLVAGRLLGAAGHHDVERRLAARRIASRRCPCCRCCPAPRPALSRPDMSAPRPATPTSSPATWVARRPTCACVRGGDYGMTTEGRVGAFPDQDPADRHQFDRRRRRQHRGARHGRLSVRRSALGGGNAGSRLLWPRRPSSRP